ncbi:tRNA (guanine-N(7)-)-methyltransferasenon-catalytic subunit [Striga asiatica]|uniref:tRNA (Guanine-N(7)-)-methyltransferasenon-catalytic subunit n=1 Tax=Striga asiatica TaxID=4170 RepID=A0A5A7PAH1_STRAF|nr:tRNA (guanine-N(7)-)-methyltransferasenon-catalytic subunit [Striga asiatica]
MAAHRTWAMKRIHITIWAFGPEPIGRSLCHLKIKIKLQQILGLCNSKIGGKKLEDVGMEESKQKLEMEVAPALIAVHPNQNSISVSVGSDILVFSLRGFAELYVVDILGCDYKGPVLMDKKAVPILSHYCSTITRLEFSPDGQYIVTADRDFKIRVTVFPKEPLNGAHEIQSFCLGHTEYISCITFVRLWDYTSGSLIDTCDVWTKAGLSNCNKEREEIMPAITDLCATSDGSLRVLDDLEIPGSKPLLQELQGKTTISKEAFFTAAEAVKTAVRNLLIKKQYLEERRELRKKERSDKKSRKLA